MAFMNELGWPLVALLVIGAGVSCGDSGARGAVFKRGTAAEPSLAKGGEPAHALPSMVVSGEVATYEATSTGPPLEKSRDTGGALPSVVAPGRSAVYAPAGQGGAAGAQGAAGLDGDP